MNVLRRGLSIRFKYHLLGIENRQWCWYSQEMSGKRGISQRTSSWQQHGSPLRVLVDMDGVLCDYEQHFLDLFRTKYPDAPYIPMEKRNCFYVDDQYKLLGEDLSDKVHGIWESEGFFRDMPPIEGAIDAVKEISGINNVEVFICTSPLTSSRIENHYSAKEKFEWIQTHMGKDWIKRMVVTRDKTIINGDLLIDDKPRITGAEKAPQWDHILFTAAHNKHLDISTLKCTHRLHNWTDSAQWRNLIEEIKKKKA